MPTAFLDRDGVINRKPAEGDYVKSWQDFEFLPGVFEAVRLLKQHGFRVIVITNQRGVSLGRLSEEDLKAIHQRMASELLKAGAALDGIYYCPHDYNSCDCRKPAIGLFVQARRDFPDIRFADSVIFGDSITDMQAGERLACKKVLIGTGNAAVLSELQDQNIQVNFSASSLLKAVTGFLVGASIGRAADE